MGCIFHKWNKWSEPRFEWIKRTYAYDGRVEEGSCQIQDRTCKRCGKYEFKGVGE